MDEFEEFTRAMKEDREESKSAKFAYRGIFTTSFVAPGTIRKTLGMVSATVVRAAGILGQMKIDFRDAFGGRSGEAERIIDEMRLEVLGKLRSNATNAGANAVIGASIKFGEFGNNVFVATAEGTAIVIDS